MRRLLALLCVLMFSAGVPAGEIESIKDQAYYEGDDADEVKHKLDLYLPKDAKDYPVVMFVHGGAWVIGDRKQYGFVGEMFARNGVGAAVISYRLSPKVQHPAHVQDVAKAFAWVKENIAKYGGKADQIFVSGHSAGGHLAALLATDESYLKAEGLALTDVKGVIPLSGVYMVIGAPLFSSIFGKDEEVAKKASPVEHVKDKHPPFLIVWADKDFPGCDLMSEKFCKLLKDGKCDAESLVIKERSHITIVFKMKDDTDPLSKAALEFIEKQSGWKRPAK